MKLIQSLRYLLEGRTTSRQTLHPPQGAPEPHGGHYVFISYARNPDESFTQRLCADLTQRGVHVWWDREAMESRGRTFQQELRDAIAAAERVLFVVSPNALKSAYCRVELEHALLFAKGILPLLREGDFDLLPTELEKLDCVDFRPARRYKRSLNELLRKLATPVAPLGPLLNLVPPLPPHFLPRREMLGAIAQTVLVDLHGPVSVSPECQLVGLYGIPGSGKSVLAAAFARSTDVRRAMPDGVVWVRMGQTEDSFPATRQIGLALGGNPTDFNSDLSARQRLPNLLADKRSLIILDDVWTMEAIQPIVNALSVRPQCRLVVTTRDAGLVKRLGAKEVCVDALQEAEALELLADWANQRVDALPEEAKAVAEQCGYLPLALAMMGAAVRDRPERWKDQLERLRRSDLDKIRQELPNYPYPNLLRALDASLDALDTDDKLAIQARERYIDFAVFPRNFPVPQTVLQMFWELQGLNALDSADVVGLLVDRSLARRGTDGKITLHDIQLDYVLHKAGDVGGLHRKLLDVYASRCSAGWPSGPNDGYFFQNLPYHLAKAAHYEELKSLLLNLDWIEATLKARSLIMEGQPIGADMSTMLADYDLLPKDRLSELVRSTLQLSAHVLITDPAQVRSQVWGRLIGTDVTDVRDFLNQNNAPPRSPWLRPLFPRLTQAGGALLHTLVGHLNVVNAVAFHPDGRRVVSASADGTLNVWDLPSSSCLRNLVGHEGGTTIDAVEHVFDLFHSSGGVTAVAITADGERIVSASADHTLKVWDLNKGTCLCTLRSHVDKVSGVALHTDGIRAVSVSADGTLKVWDLGRGECLRTIGGRGSAGKAVALHADGRRAVCAWNNVSLAVWDIESGECLGVLGSHDNIVTAVALHSDERRAVSASWDGTLKVWDLDHGECLRTLGGQTNAEMAFGTGMTALALHAGGQRVLSGSVDGVLRVWDLETAACLRKLRGNGGWIRGLALHPDGRRAVSAGMGRILEIWDLDAGTESVTQERHASVVWRVALDAKRKRAVSASADGTLKLWDLRNSRCLRTLGKHDGWVWGIALHPDGRRVVSGSEDCTLKVWSLESGECLKTLLGHTEGVAEVTLHPDGKRAVSASGDRTLKVWDLESGACVLTLSGHKGEVTGVKLQADGQRAVSASSDGTLKVWDLENGECLKTVADQGDRFWALGLQADGARAVTTSADSTEIKLWDLQSGKCLRSMRGHAHRIRGLAMDPTGRWAVSGSNDFTLKVWDTVMGEAYATFSGDAGMTACAVASDGVTIFAGDSEGQVHLFSLESVKQGPNLLFANTQ